MAKIWVKKLKADYEYAVFEGHHLVQRGLIGFLVLWAENIGHPSYLTLLSYMRQDEQKMDQKNKTNRPEKTKSVKSIKS